MFKKKKKCVTIPFVPVREAIFLGLARTSYVIGVSNHGSKKWVPSGYISAFIPPILVYLIARCPPSTFLYISSALKIYKSSSSSSYD